MATLPTQFRKSGDQIVNTIDFQDLASNTGQTLVYGSSAQVSGATVYLLTKQVMTVYAEGRYKTASGTPTTSLEVNFDTGEFNRPTIVDGDFVVSIPTYIYNASQTADYNTTVRLLKVDTGATETEICSITSQAYAYNGGIGSSSSNTVYLTGSCTRTKINRTDKLRIEVIMTLLASSGGTHNLWVVFDPEDAQVDVSSPTSLTIAASGTSALTALIPFQILT